MGGQVANGEGQGRDGRYRRRQDGSPAHLDLDLGFFLEVGRSLSSSELSLVSPTRSWVLWDERLNAPLAGIAHSSDLSRKHICEEPSLAWGG